MPISSLSYKSNLTPSFSLIGLIGLLGLVAAACSGRQSDAVEDTVQVVSRALTFSENAGVVSMEAENFTTNTAQGGKTWTAQTTSSPSGGSALIATPDTGAANNTGYTTTSPRLNFSVTFTQTGTWQVWVRGRAGGSVVADSDSVHVGLDGAAVASADRISTFTNAFGWSRSTLDSVNATLNVTTAGVHTVNVWMREDGFVIDKLVLARSTTFTPTGTGPAETPTTTPACPDATCNGTETCSTCPADCGACPTCTDGVQNGTETGVDCGGSCPACNPGGPQAVWLEAEAGVRSGSPTFTVQSDAQASGGQNLLPPTGSSASTPGTARVRFTFSTGAGTFKVWARAITPNADDDSFWVAMDGGAFVKWNALPVATAWAWDDLHNSDNNSAVVTYTLAAGTHTLDVANREDGARLDKLYVTALGDTPTGLGGGTGPTCTDGMMNGTETGVDCGGTCPACATCSDGVRNGTETGVDCGGTCPACATCSDGVRNGTETGVDCGGTCPACATCSDGVRNGTETGVDCGGTCPACPMPTCTDGVQNGTETGVDCGGTCPACPTASTAVWLEAEGGTRSGSPTFSVASSAAASGGSYLTTTSADSANTPGPNRVTFSVTVGAGTYALWARVIAPSASDDSLWVKVDAGAFVKWNDITNGTAWLWARVRNSDSANALMSYTLTAGVHTIEIANRENGISLDKLYLTANGDTPTGLGGGGETCGNGTCGAGESCSTCPGDCGVCGPWSSLDIGAVGAVGGMSQAGGVFTVNGSGDDIHSSLGNPMDEFHFVYQQVTGDATIVARVNSVQNTNEWAKGGVMFRDTLDTGARFALVLMRPDRQVQSQFRPTVGATGTDSGTQTGGTTAVKWLKIERVGNTFRTSYSTDGTTFTQVGTTTTIAMAATAYVGLAVTSHNDGTLCAAQFDNVSVTSVTVCNNNGTCDAGESCSNCAADCGACGQLGLDSRPSNTTCLAPAPLAASYALQDKWANITFTNPVQVVQPPGDSSRLIVIQRNGAARSVPINATSASQTSAFVTLSNVVTSSNGGLLSMAFHPDWTTNHYAYVVYTTSNRMKRLSRFQSTDGGQTLNTSTEQVVLQIQHLVEFNHNGGQIAFGHDGYLYMSTGDDAYLDYARARQAANPNNLFGKVLRLDVNGGSPYAIPVDNPFAFGGGAPEVFAYGFRNPWRFSVDRLTGDVWVADVGESTWEEVNIIQSGGFYGWPYYEGETCFQNSSQQPGDCSTPYVRPVTTYGGGSGGRSISGGFVYRGSALPSLYGKYLFGDYVSGQVYIYDPATDANTALPNSTGGATVAWGEDNAGELYAVRYDTGRVQQLVAGSGGAADFPNSLHQTGCFDTVNRTAVTSGVIPYTIAQPFWSDGASKERYLALPNGTTISVNSAGDWTLPEGSVTIKNFRYNGKLFETRFVVRHTANRGYSAYTYSWTDDEQNAFLVPASGSTRSLDASFVWDYPARDQCFACHTTAAGFSLGLETRQVNINGFYPSTGRTANQLATLAGIGMFSGNPAALAPMPAIGDTAVPLQQRAEAYLHANCSHCHRPGGPGVGPMDARFDTPFASKGVCNVAPSQGTLGIPGAMLVKPGAPDSSIVYVRMSTRVDTSMPPLASRLVDTQGATLLQSWISGLTTCP